MRYKHLLLLSSIIATPVCAQVERGGVVSSTPSISTSAKFDWKLRLVAGQKWTQTTTVESSTLSGGAKFGIHMKLVLRNEVLFAKANEYVLQCAFSQFDQTIYIAHIDNGENVIPQPDRSKFTRGFLGIPFKIKLTPKGKVTVVSGLEKLVKAGHQAIENSAQSQAEKKALFHVLHDAEFLKSTIIRYCEVVTPSKPLGVGEKYTDVFEAYPSFDSMEKVTTEHTLLAFDGNTARFGDKGTLSTYTDQPEFRRVGGDKEPIYEVSSGKVSGETFVDGATGLLRRTQKFEASIKTTVIHANGKRDTSTTKKQMQVTTSTKLHS